MVLQMFIPKYIFSRLEKNKFEDLPERPICTHTGQGEHTLILTHNPDNVHTHIHTTPETATIFADDVALDAYLMTTNITDDTLVIPKKLTPAKKYAAYIRVLHGDAPKLLMTRN